MVAFVVAAPGSNPDGTSLDAHCLERIALQAAEALCLRRLAAEEQLRQGAETGVAFAAGERAIMVAASEAGGPFNPKEGFMAEYGTKAQSKVKKAMHERKTGTLRSGKSGKKVTSRKQAIAIGLSEARRAGGKVPAKKSAKKSTKRARKKSTKRAAKKSTKRAATKSTKKSARKTTRKST